jgi:hypothetical protein
MERYTTESSNQTWYVSIIHDHVPGPPVLPSCLSSVMSFIPFDYQCVDESRELFREFIRTDDGAIIEIFDDIDSLGALDYKKMEEKKYFDRNHSVEDKEKEIQDRLHHDSEVEAKDKLERERRALNQKWGTGSNATNDDQLSMAKGIEAKKPANDLSSSLMSSSTLVAMTGTGITSLDSTSSIPMHLLLSSGASGIGSTNAFLGSGHATGIGIASQGSVSSSRAFGFGLSPVVETASTPASIIIESDTYNSLPTRDTLPPDDVTVDQNDDIHDAKRAIGNAFHLSMLAE